MRLLSTLRAYSRPRPALFTLLTICALAVSIVKADPPPNQPDVVRLKVIVTVMDNLGNTMANADVLIPRQSPNNVQGTTRENGTFVEDNVAFKISRAPYKLTVSAPDYVGYQTDISAEDLRQAFLKDKTLSLDATLVKTNQAPQATPAKAATTPEVETPLINWGEVNARLRAFLNATLWWLGILFVVFAAAALAYFLLGRRVDFYQPDANARPLRDEIRDLVSDVKVLRSDVKASIGEAGTITKQLVEVDRSLGGIKQQLANIETAGVSTGGNRSNNTEAGGGANSKGTNYSGVTSHDTPSDSRPGEQKAARTGPRREQAISAYKSLVSGYTPHPEPLYVEAEGDKAFGKLEDRSVYLREGGSEGTFVLFPDDSKEGWVFPNPRLRFRQSALSPLFPNLTEGEFDQGKDGIAPRRARKLEDSRWCVESTESQ